jgi:hypothetical protein
MTYSEWNGKLGAYFFNSYNAGKRIFLSVDEALLVKLGGVDAKADFIAAVKAGPPEYGRSHLSVCAVAERIFEAWQQSHGKEVPPFIAYLALFVLGASEEGEDDQDGYHKTLRRLLGEPTSNNWISSKFGEMWCLWEGLRMWANEELQGELGVISCDFAGAWPHKGLPRAQIVLTERERSHLPVIFEIAEVDPIAPPTVNELARLVRGCGRGLLEARTLRRLSPDGTGDSEVRDLLLEALIEELRSWDGSVTEGQHDIGRCHALRLNLQFTDRLRGLANTRVVVRDTPSFTEDVIRVSVNGTTAQIAHCNAEWLCLQDNEGNTIDAASLQWNLGIRLTAGKMIFRLPQRKVRVFRKGEFDRIEGLIEVNRLDPHREFYVSAADDCSEKVEAWGMRAGLNWSRIPLRSGLSPKTVLFKADRADVRIAAPREFPALQADSHLRLLLAGGIKLEPASTRYFSFAPPKIRIEGLEPNSLVSVNETSIPVDAGDVTLILPEEFLRSVNQVAVVTESGHKLTRSFQLSSGEEVSWKSGAGKFTNAKGEIVDISFEGPRVTGGTAVNYNPPPIFMVPAKRSDVIGRRPGEIAVIPDEPPPTDWSPVWIVERGRSNRRVIFCGSDIQYCVPSKEEIPDKKRVKSWKDLLWYDWRKLRSPSLALLSSLWKQYRDVAKDV